MDGTGSKQRNRQQACGAYAPQNQESGDAVIETAGRVYECISRKLRTIHLGEQVNRVFKNIVHCIRLLFPPSPLLPPLMDDAHCVGVRSHQGTSRGFRLDALDALMVHRGFSIYDHTNPYLRTPNCVGETLSQNLPIAKMPLSKYAWDMKWFAFPV